MTQAVDRVNFVLTISVMLALAIPLLLFPEASALALQTAYSWLATNFGWLYILTAITAFGAVLFIAFGPYARVRLGDEAPEFSTASWIAMLFAAGIGSGMMYWASIEWAFYVDTPPFGAEPRSAEAYIWASSFGLHHWGLVAWSFYCLPTLAIAYPFYARGVSKLKYSISASHFIKGGESSIGARLMDSFFMVALVGGIASSLGFSTPMIAALVSRLTGIPESFGMELAVVGVCVVMFGTSVWLGLKAGIKRLSDFNMVLAGALLLMILLAGDTVFLLRMAINSIGHTLQNTVAMMFWTDPVNNTGFIEDWTIFYWAWWLAYGPFIGIFVTRISKGRSLREVVLGMLGMGSMGVWLFYLIVGNHSLGLQVSGEVDILGVMAESGGNQAIIAGLDALPFASLFIVGFILLCSIFTATTYDSASYVLAASATKSLKPSEDPAQWHRVFWAVAITILPIALMYAGGLKEAQTITLVVSLPLVFTFWLSGISLLKSLQEDYGDQSKT
ncbi:BCCT family transporter [Luminiphilus sp.]|jgi:BCCT family betaine/carnitine transporter|nr:BCCT family transporter [Luminiphilus sp.]MDB2315963.1 BCCT family transporter [Luminiphilus sp.]MDB2377210.1 BCCT family transporter [Luminiphilus sp.]MDB2380753.1 BCCT family transporter [Luminiphilus sp.]MDB2512256.1 BCCT family transporter [Luminiphilus sp.]